jgi:SAM-dependent methyltransferase
VGEGDSAADLARWYDLDLRDDPGDLDVYRALAARTGGPILELAVGSGRIAVPLAAAGLEVVGIDQDQAMLARADRRWKDAQRATEGGRSAPDRGSPAGDRGSLELIEADLLEADLGARFGLVILALNSLLLLAEAERQARALKAMARHLRRDGLAVVDVWLPPADDLAAYDGRLLVEWTRNDEETGERVSKSSSATFDAATAAVELLTFFDAWPAGGGALRRVERLDRLRLVGAEELLRMASDAGLAPETLAGDHEMSSFGPGAERALLVAGLV